MPLIEAFWLGVVEGLTEYLPISSTGHLILASAIFDHDAEVGAAFDIVIQLGAILAVLVHFRGLLFARLTGLFRQDPLAVRLFLALIVGFLPAAIIGLVARKAIKAQLFGPFPVAVALIVGGIVMIVVERIRKRRQIIGEAGIDKVTPQRALVIGIAQCFALWPGMSRSMSTIVGGQLAGLSTATAAEFSFLLGLPTLGAAALYEAYKSREILAQSGGSALLVGLVTSFLVAWAVIRVFIRYLQRRGLEPFGWYRIILGALVAYLVASAPYGG